jgi:hypothetical protein
MSIRLKTALILVATLVLGIIIGALGSIAFRRHQIRSTIADLRQRPSFLEYTMKIIQPTETQEDTVRAILEEHHQKLQNVSIHQRQEMIALVDSMETRLQSVLTDQQMERLRQRRQRRRPPPFGKPGDHPHPRDARRLRPGTRPALPPPPHPE